ncbi:unnamed protein product [Rotaria sordida]|uniref:F-box domain-containing protein n=1 Tax=Rotaria sordida TaxID=392033 RepID=A0A819MW24_9BILA|nr:unnamed protein product [Rotaria sordida]CAF3987168.1 unnamed protein product [Rotaria sordida]
MMSSIKSKFEDFPAEIYSEIFQYLSGFNIYVVFDRLNSRFRLLLRNYSFSLDCTKYRSLVGIYLAFLCDITPKAIRSLTIKISLDLSKELFLTLHNPQQFIKLEQLNICISQPSISNDKNNILQEILEKFSEFPKLSRLLIMISYEIGNSETVKNIYKMLFNLLPLKLKYLRLQLALQDTIPMINEYELLSNNNDRSTLLYDNDYERLNRQSLIMIEYLTILNYFDINNLKYIFLLMPKLKYLNINLYDENNFEMHRDPYYPRRTHIKPYNLNDLESLIPLNLKRLDMACDVSIDYKDLIEFLFEPMKRAQIKLSKVILQIHLYEGEQTMVEQLIQTTLSTNLTMTVKLVYALTLIPYDEYMGMEYYASRNLAREINYLYRHN